MNKQDIIEMLNLHLTELTDTANAKKAEMHQQLSANVAQATTFLRQLQEAEQYLALQLAESERLLHTLSKPETREMWLAEIELTEDTDIATAQHQLAEKVHLQITEWKAETISNEQALTDKIAESKQSLNPKSTPWADYQKRFNARFGKQIQWGRAKLVEVLMFCANKLKTPACNG